MFWGMEMSGREMDWGGRTVGEGNAFSERESLGRQMYWGGDRLLDGMGLWVDWFGECHEFGEGDGLGREVGWRREMGWRRG